jgi:m7GpppX diphosphatase
VFIIDPLSKTASVLGNVDGKNAILTFEKIPFGGELEAVTSQLESASINPISRNDIYRWFLASKLDAGSSIKVNVIYPATETHIRKHEKQKRRMIIETPDIYKEHVEPYVQTMKGSRIQWYS